MEQWDVPPEYIEEFYEVESELQDEDLERLFGDVKFFHITLLTTLPVGKAVICDDGQDVFLMPLMINVLREEREMVITEENVVEFAFAYARLSDPAAYSYLEMVPESLLISQDEAHPYIVEFQTYSALGGLVTDWTFLFYPWDDIQEVKWTIVAKEVGEWIEPHVDYQRYKRPLDAPRQTHPPGY